MVISVLFWLCFDCFWRLVHCWYSPGRPVTIGTPMAIFAGLTVFWLFLTIGTPLVHCWYSLGRPVTISIPMVLSVFDDWYSVPFVKNSQKTVKQQKSPNTQSRANAATLRNLPSHVHGQWPHPSPVGRADCMCLHGRSCVWLPFAAACGYTLFYLLQLV